MSRLFVILTPWACASITPAGTGVNSISACTTPIKCGLERDAGRPLRPAFFFGVGSVQETAEQPHAVGIGLGQFGAAHPALVYREMLAPVAEHHPMPLARDHLHQPERRAFPGIRTGRIAITQDV